MEIGKILIVDYRDRGKQIRIRFQDELGRFGICGKDTCRHVLHYRHEALNAADYVVILVHVGNEYCQSPNCPEGQEPIHELWENVSMDRRVIGYSGGSDPWSEGFHPPQADRLRIDLAIDVAGPDDLFIGEFVAEWTHSGKLPAASIMVRGAVPRAYEAKLRILYHLLAREETAASCCIEDSDVSLLGSVEKRPGWADGYRWITKSQFLAYKQAVNSFISATRSGCADAFYRQQLAALRDILLRDISFVQ